MVSNKAAAARGDADDVAPAELPVPERPDNNPLTTAWEVRDERAALGLAKADRVRSLQSIAEQRIDGDRVHCRGRVWMHRDHRSEPGGSIKLVGERGSLRIDVESQARLEELTDDVGVTIRDLRVDESGRWSATACAIDEATELLTWDKAAKQRTSLQTLAMVDGWPRRYEIDASEAAVRLALKDRAERLREAFAPYGNVTVGVRYAERERTRRQLRLEASFDQLLLPRDYQYVYRCVAGVDGINWMGESGFRGVRYEVQA